MDMLLPPPLEQAIWPLLPGTAAASMIKAQPGVISAVWGEEGRSKMSRRGMEEIGGKEKKEDGEGGGRSVRK